MAVGLDASKRLVEALREVVGSKGKDSTRAYATCTRIDKDGTRWVRLIGSDTDTPVNGSTYFQSELNDLLEVEVSDGVMSIVGNVTSPAVGQAYVNNAMSASRVDMALQLGDTVKELISDFGTILTSALSSYMTSGQTASAISAAINAAFNMSSATSKITQAFATAFDLTSSSSYASLFVTYLDAYVIGPAISVAEGVLNANIARAVADIVIGGRNWLRDTQTYDSWTLAGVTVSDGVATFPADPAGSQLSWYAIVHPAVVPIEEFLKGSWTISFDYRSDSFSSTDGYPYVYVNKIYCDQSGTPIYEVKLSADEDTQFIPTPSWQRGSITFTGEYGELPQGYEDVPSRSKYGSVSFFKYTHSGYQLRNMKLEHGNKPSEYDISTSDILEAADDAITIANNAYAAVVSMAVVQRGTVSQSQSVSANGYRDYEITFADEFDSVPVVTATIYTTTEATTSFNCDIYLRSVSKTGFTARIINREGASRSPGFHWQAVGVLAD